MSIASWLLALGMMLVLEGIFPALMPREWKQTFQRLTQLQDGQLRFFGLLSVVVGMVLIFILSFNLK